MNGLDATEDVGGLIDASLNKTDYHDLLAKEYVRLASLKAGYTASVPELDRTGVDIVIEAKGELFPEIKVQCKGVPKFLNVQEDGCYVHSIRKKMYNSYREPRHYSFIVVLVQFPQHPRDSIHFDIEEVLIQARAHYVRPRKWQKATQLSEESKVPVRYPEENEFNPERLRELMERIRKGEKL